MKGIVKRFDGRTGFAVGEDGRTYFLHINHISKEVEGSLSRIKKSLSKLKGGEITFSPKESDGKHPLAMDIKFEHPRGWVPRRTKDGFWVINQEFNIDSPWRCSSCGHTSHYPYKFCPHCGVPMTGDTIKECK